MAMTDNNALAQEQLAIRIENRARISAKQNVIVLKDEIPIILAALRTPAPAPVGGDVVGLRALVHESLFHLRLDAGAKAYHDKALAALQSPPAPEQDAVERVAFIIAQKLTPPQSGEIFRMPKHVMDTLSGRDGSISYTWDFAEECRDIARAALAAMLPKVEADHSGDANDMIDQQAKVEAPAADEVRELVEAAYREGHQRGRIDGSYLEEDHDWSNSDAIAMLERLSHPTADAVAVERNMRGWLEWYRLATADDDNEYLNGKAWDDAEALASTTMGLLAAIRSGGAS